MSSAEAVLNAWIDPCGSDTGGGILQALHDGGYVVVRKSALIDAIQWRDWDAVRALLEVSHA